MAFWGADEIDALLAAEEDGEKYYLSQGDPPWLDGFPEAVDAFYNNLDGTVGGSGDQPEGSSPVSTIVNSVVNSDVDAVSPTAGIRTPTPEGSPAGTPVQPAHDNAERPGEAMTHAEATARFNSVEENVGQGRYREMLRELQEKMHPQYVPMQELSEKDFFEDLLQFFREAAGQGRTPAHSFEGLADKIRGLGLDPDSILGEPGGPMEQRWNIPSPNNKASPGTARQHMAWGFFLNILKRLARVCGSGTDCFNLVNVSNIHDPYGLAGLHFDHDVNHRTMRILEKFEAIGSKMNADSDQRAKDAVAELVTCKLLCASCHYQGEKSGGIVREKRTPAARNR